jgi:hypothetical protein
MGEKPRGEYSKKESESRFIAALRGAFDRPKKLVPKAKSRKKPSPKKKK